MIVRACLSVYVCVCVSLSLSLSLLPNPCTSTGKLDFGQFVIARCNFCFVWASRLDNIDTSRHKRGKHGAERPIASLLCPHAHKHRKERKQEQKEHAWDCREKNQQSAELHLQMVLVET